MSNEATSNREPGRRPASSLRRVRWALLILGFAAIGLGALGYSWYASRPLLYVHHAPRQFGPRTSDFTANITGETGRFVNAMRYRVNDGEWRPLPRSGPRVPPPAFTVELGADELREGENTLVVAASAPLRSEARLAHTFSYDPTPPALPIRIDWADWSGRSDQLDAQDGSWEVFESELGHRVRPTPGAEGYDRILALTGVFPGGRRIETDVVLRQANTEGKLWGFGVLGMWGGWPDAAGVRPRRGWSYGLQWYYSRYEAVCAEFALRDGASPFTSTTACMRFFPEPGVRYRIIAECWPVESDESADAEGVRWRQRMKWWKDGEPEPVGWLKIDDAPGSPMPAGPYATGLLAHRCQVDFGPVTITPIQGRADNPK